MSTMEGLEQRRSRSASYYAVLSVSRDASHAEIRNAYRRLALRWHPDRRRGQQEMVDEAKRRFQEIQEAYQVLSDAKRRRLYDSGLYDPDEDEEEPIEGFHDFVQEMVSLMASVRKERKQYTLGELQQMLFEMAQDFNSPAQPRWSANRGSLQNLKSMADEMESETKKRARMGFPSKDLFGGKSSFSEPNEHWNLR